MGDNQKKKRAKNGSKGNGTFHSKHINHNPQAESARAVYGLQDQEKG